VCAKKFPTGPLGANACGIVWVNVRGIVCTKKPPTGPLDENVCGIVCTKKPPIGPDDVNGAAIACQKLCPIVVITEKLSFSAKLPLAAAGRKLNSQFQRN
jgi:hypothetical protein